MTRYELRINGGYLEEFYYLDLKTLDTYNQVAIDNPSCVVELVKVTEEVIRSNSSEVG